MNESQKLSQVEATQAAVTMWEGMTDNEKHGVRFGLFPAAKMTADNVSHIEPRLLAVALMDCASRNGGMIA